MKLLALCLLFAPAMFAQNPSNPGKGLPPLIDRELLFGNPELAGAQISPDGAAEGGPLRMFLDVRTVRAALRH